MMLIETAAGILTMGLNISCVTADIVVIHESQKLGAYGLWLGHPKITRALMSRQEAIPLGRRALATNKYYLVEDPFYSTVRNK